MNMTAILFKRELRAYFATPVAFVFLVVFLVLCGIFSFQMGGFFQRGQADMVSLFRSLPILYMVLIPAIGMRLWAEERRSGTIEMLMTLPVSTAQAVLGKFLAAWAFTGVALAATVPLWVTVNYLGQPDNGVIVASYLGALLMAGAYLSLCACFSALTDNQVIAFVLSVMVCLVFTLCGTRVVIGYLSGLAPAALLDLITSLSFMNRFDAIVRGVVDARDVLFFLSFMALGMFANVVIIDRSKAR
ncbi:MAG: ABC transporter permease [Planctomycetota bacterium]|nr:MAG: ABC transporter permease [Planctomycetota bacterium]